MEMRYCADQGIPHSVWLEKWTPEDRAKVIAFLVESAERCDMCGTAPWEWEENKYAYEPVDHFCQGCYLKSVYSDSESTSLAGTNVQLIPVTEGRKLERLIADEKRRQRMKKRPKED